MSKKNFINETHIEGYVYEHDLQARVSGENSKNPGTKFIMGTISLATNEEMTNIIPIHYTRVTPTYGSGKENPNYQILSDIIDGKIFTVMRDGADKAHMLRIDSAFGLNDFYVDRNGEQELVSSKRNEGGFIHKVSALNEDETKRDTFKTDMVITKAFRREADEERNLPEKMILSGAIFDFRGSLLPVDFSVLNPGAMNYFESLAPSSTDPVFTKVWGRQVSETVVRKTVEESAFGEDLVREVTSSRRDFVVTGAAKEPYIWDDESTLTAEDLKAKMQDRQTYLASVKQRADDYRASKNAPESAFPAAPVAAAPVAAAPAKGEFKF